MRRSGVGAWTRPGNVMALLMAAAGCLDASTSPAPTISGLVTLRSESGVPLVDASGVRILLLADGAGTVVTTGADGQFALEARPGVAYRLEAERAGFATIVATNVVAGGAPLGLSLPERSSAVPTAVTASREPCGTVDCLALDITADHAFTPTIRRRLFRAFIGPLPGLTSTQYDQSLVLIVPDDQPDLVREGDRVVIPLRLLHGVDFARHPADSTLGVLVFGATENFAAAYTDPVTGRAIFADLSPASSLAVLRLR